MTTPNPPATAPSIAGLATIDDAITAIASGQFVIVVDDENRENEGDLILAAEAVTAEKIAFLVRHTTGIVCVAMTECRLGELRLPQMVSGNTDTHQTAFTVSVDAAATTTGVSAADRATTIRHLIDPATVPDDLHRPGHVFPLQCKEGGVLERPGHTEAAVDLAHLAGVYPAGVLAEVVNDDGTMARLPRLLEFAAEHGLLVISIQDLRRHRIQREIPVRRVSSASIRTPEGEFEVYAYRSNDGPEHLALVMGDVSGQPDVLIRMHSECLTGDVFGSLRCDCGEQLRTAMARIAHEGRGVVIYLRGHEGRGIGIAHKLRAYRLQDQGRDTVEANLELGYPADSRNYDAGAQILRDLAIVGVRLLTNNPDKYRSLIDNGFAPIERVPLLIEPGIDNVRYLLTKKAKLGHLLELDGPAVSGFPIPIERTGTGR
jgi:3,4-dihydroxy 2-butanone 4-phosphate synthase/GTP cyclohydrolase II